MVVQGGNGDSGWSDFTEWELSCRGEWTCRVTLQCK